MIDQLLKSPINWMTALLCITAFVAVLAVKNGDAFVAAACAFNAGIWFAMAATEVTDS